MEAKSDNIKLLVVSANSLVREGIISMLGGEDDIKVVDQASNMLELMEYLDKSTADIVIVNDDTKGISSLEAIRLINQKAIDARVLLLIDEYDNGKELTAVKMGVSGLLLEKTGKDNFIRCIRTINRGEMWARRKIMEKSIKELLQRQKTENQTLFVPPFTKREVEVMALVSKGYRNKEIGKKLFINEKTVKHYLLNIFKKLNIKKRKDIRRYFFEESS